MISRHLLITVTLIFLVTVCYAQNNQTTQQVAVSNGIGLGAAIAVTISWSQNKSIMWAIIHGILSWIYVIYYFFTRK